MNKSIKKALVTGFVGALMALVVTVPAFAATSTTGSNTTPKTVKIMAKKVVKKTAVVKKAVKTTKVKKSAVKATVPVTTPTSDVPLQ